VASRLKLTKSEWKLGALNGVVAAIAANVVVRLVGSSFWLQLLFTMAITGLVGLPLSYWFLKSHNKRKA
jgi:hypothetical protein